MSDANKLKKPSLSSRILVPMRLKKRSPIGELMRGSVPAWVEHLKDNGLTEEQEKKLKDTHSDCQLCKCSLKGLTDMEPQNKKVCRVCDAVLCRQCTTQVHIKGHLRRRYVCFQCVGEAAVYTNLVQAKVVEVEVAAQQQPISPGSTSSANSSTEPVSPRSDLVSQQEQEEEEGMFGNFVTRLWDTWSGWTGVGGSGRNESLDFEEEVATQLESPKQFPEQNTPQTTMIELTASTSLPQQPAMIVLVSDKFNGDHLQQLMELAHLQTRPNVLCVPFTDACREIVKLMGGLGKAFEFAGGDMNDKLRIMDRRSEECGLELAIPHGQVTMQQMVEREIKAKTTHAGKKAAGATRTVVRLLWFLDFIAVLLQKLGDQPTTSLVGTIGTTYDETLSPRHVWVLRRVVKSGMSLVPEKKAFLERMSVQHLTEQEQCAKFKSWANTLDLVRKDMWMYMESKGLTEIP